MLEPVPVDVGKVATPQQKVSHGSIGVTDCSAPTTAKDSEEDLEIGSPVANDGYDFVDLTFDTQLEDRQPEQDSPASFFKLELPDDADDDLTPTQVSSSKHLPSPPPRVEQSVEKQNNGTMNVQPMIPEAEPFQGLESEWDEIPDILDDLAPKFHPGQAQLSPEAIRARSRRIFQKRADGSKKVTDEIWNDWNSKGKKRKVLEEIFKRCGYDPDSWHNHAFLLLLFLA